MNLFDHNGRCCGRKPIEYKGGSWRSPPNSPLFFCTRCHAEYDGKTGEQRPNFAWTQQQIDELARKAQQP